MVGVGGADLASNSSNLKRSGIFFVKVFWPLGREVSQHLKRNRKLETEFQKRLIIEILKMENDQVLVAVVYSSKFLKENNYS